MLGQAAFALLGFLGVAVSNGLFGEFSFYINAALLGLLFFALIMRQRTVVASCLLFGFILGLDLTSTVRSGSLVLFGACIILLAYYLPRLLRFTTPLMQGIVGLLIVIILYPLFSFGHSGFFHRLLLLIPLFFILSGGIVVLFRGSTEPIHDDL